MSIPADNATGNSSPGSSSSSWHEGLRELASAYPALSLESPTSILRVRAGLEAAERAGLPFVFSDYACASLALEGVPTAIRVVVEGRLRPLRSRLDRFKTDGVQPDDLCAELELKLLAAEEPLLARYSGRGSLEGWLRILLTRAALDSRRVRRPEDGAALADDMPHLRAPIADPELEVLRRQSTEVFREAFYDAVGELTAEHRAALRLHLFEELTLDETARALGVHRATVARWLAAARDELFANTRRLLATRLNLRPEDCESLSRFVLSGVELSLSRVLGE